MQAAGIDKRVVDNLRHTDAAVLAVVRRVLRHENLRLVEALQVEGVRATSIQSGVFEAEFLDRDRYGLVGRVAAVDTDGIHAAIKVGSIPVIASLGETRSEEHTSELQSLMRISYAVFCLKKKRAIKR